MSYKLKVDKFIVNNTRKQSHVIFSLKFSVTDENDFLSFQAMAYYDNNVIQGVYRIFTKQDLRNFLVSRLYFCINFIIYNAYNNTCAFIVNRKYTKVDQGIRINLKFTFEFCARGTFLFLVHGKLIVCSANE